MTTTIISVDDYFGRWITHPDATDEVMDNAVAFLAKVNSLLQDALDHGVKLSINPHTGDYVSGQTYGGFRPQDCVQGAPTSSHKVGRGVDVCDPNNALDAWLDTFELGYGTNSKLEEFALYREAPEDTPSWLHLTDRAPKSNKRTFKP
jgi:hypothetical protein